MMEEIVRTGIQLGTVFVFSTRCFSVSFGGRRGAHDRTQSRVRLVGTVEDSKIGH